MHPTRRALHVQRIMRPVAMPAPLTAIVCSALAALTAAVVTFAVLAYTVTPHTAPRGTQTYYKHGHRLPTHALHTSASPNN